MNIHNRFYVEAMTISGDRPIKVPGVWFAYKNGKAEKFNQQAAAMGYSRFFEFVDGETKEDFFERQKQWQNDVTEHYLDLLAKEYPNVPMEKIKEVTNSFLNDEDHLKVLDIVSNSINEAKELAIRSKINNIDNLTAGDLVVVWEDDFYTGDNNQYYIRRFKCGNEETGKFDTWWMNTEDFEDFDSWKFCVRFEDFQQLLDEKVI